MPKSYLEQLAMVYDTFRINNGVHNTCGDSRAGSRPTKVVQQASRDAVLSLCIGIFSIHRQASTRHAVALLQCQEAS